MVRTVTTSILILAALFGLTGCGNAGSDRDTNSTTTAPSINRATTPAQDNLFNDTESTAADSDANNQVESEPESSGQQTPSASNSIDHFLPPPSGRPSEGVVDISFEDIRLPIQEDMVFRPFMLTDRARELDGKRIRISGYMLPDTKTRGITEFVLLKNTECKFGPGGQADHLLSVKMIPGEGTRFRDDPISVEGTLIIKPFQGPDGNTWSIYDLTCERVSRYQTRR